MCSIALHTSRNSLDIAAGVPRSGSGWSSMWSKEEILGEEEKTVQISSRWRDDSMILDISGDVDFANSLEARQSLLDAVRESRSHRVVVNLSQVQYIDSSGVASLVEALKASRDLGSRFILFGLRPSVREVFQLSRLNTVFEIYDNEEEALAA